MCRRILIALAVMAVTTDGLAYQPRPAGVLIVKMAGFRNAKGRADVLLFNSPRGFPDDEPSAFGVDEVQIDPAGLTAQVVFRDVPQGAYAVTVLHDENKNRKLDTNFIGIPREGYGISMNPPRRYRNPRFDEAKFSLPPAGAEIQIRLIYF
jgi:uncharacterized protein (DUF2141 family)